MARLSCPATAATDTRAPAGVAITTAAAGGGLPWGASRQWRRWRGSDGGVGPPPARRRQPLLLPKFCHRHFILCNNCGCMPFSLPHANPPSLLLHSRRLFSSAARLPFPPDPAMPSILSYLSHIQARHSKCGENARPGGTGRRKRRTDAAVPLRPMRHLAAGQSTGQMAFRSSMTTFGRLSRDHRHPPC